MKKFTNGRSLHKYFSEKYMNYEKNKMKNEKIQERKVSAQIFFRKIHELFSK
jgi:hypothetical protein